MSVEKDINEGVTSKTDPEDNSEAEVQGACGGSPTKASLTFDQLSEIAIDDPGDNLSMEVQFGEGSSRHPSELSSLSYQNLLDEGEPMTNTFPPQESEDSADEIDIPTDDIERYEQPKMPLPHNFSWRKPASEHAIEVVSTCSSRDKDLKKSDLPFRNIDLNLPEYFTADAGHLTVSAVTSHPLSSDQENELWNLRSIKGEQSCRNSEEETDVVKKRNSLEIRNNIPVVGEVKSYEKDVDNFNFSIQGAKPKILKQSPGLARRIADDELGNLDRDSSSSEREPEKGIKKISEQTMNGRISRDKSPTNSTLSSKSSTISAKDGSDLNPVTRFNVDIQNEYDYVKYARVQQGNSYVGMRLAYSSSNDSLNFKRNSTNSMTSNSIDSSRESSPEKILQQKILKELGVVSAQGDVNEETLTEIPLNSNDINGVEEKHTFTLSPENTECDSAEVESVISDGDRSNLGMPNVEDGLSSSQASDADDSYSLDNNHTPTKMLRRKQKANIDSDKFKKERNGLPRPKEIDAQAIMDDLKSKREALDLAILDIKSAITKSKSVTLTSPYNEEKKGEANDPVWLPRDNHVQKLQRREEMRKVREEIERQHEEAYSKGDTSVHSMENDTDNPVNNKCTKNDGKVYQAPRGYETDDELEDGTVQYTHRSKGKKYAALPKDDADTGISRSHRELKPRPHSFSEFCDNANSSHNNGTFEHHRQRLHNSESQYSSDEYYSDIEPTSSTAYHFVKPTGDYDTDEETDRLLQKQYNKDQYIDIPELTESSIEKRKSKAKEAHVRDPNDPTVLIEGVLFRARYLGSTQLISEGQPSKALRMMQAQEAVGRIKTLGSLHFGDKYQAPEGENQPSTDVDLFVSTDKIMILNTDLQEIMMDHALRTISYIADIGELLVIMARRRIITSPSGRKQAKILCHVFESDEAQLIAQSIGQAFQVAYMEFLKANGIEDPGLMKEMDYQDVLNQQEIYGEELSLFANKELHKEVIVPKAKSEPIGVVIVESGWGSMVPTVVLANMAPAGPAARCGQLNIGDQIISINGVSLVGLPLSACQTYIKGAKSQTVVKLTVVPCPPVVEVLIKRPDVKYQLGFSVQNGVICSLLRGGIAERGGVRVGHRIIEINNQSVVAVPHEKIVSLLASSVGEIHMKTMPTSIFRLLTGQETPHYL